MTEGGLMRERFKGVIFAVAGGALLAGLGWGCSRGKPEAVNPERTVRLANSAELRVHGQLPSGLGEMIWELWYRGPSSAGSGGESSGSGGSGVPGGTGWEKANEWMVDGQVSWYAGNLLACPVGKLVVVARTDGSWISVRSAAEQWKTYSMAIPDRPPFSVASAGGASFSAAEIQELRSRMSVNPALLSFSPALGQLVSDGREAWVDYVAPGDHRFRMRLSIAAGGNVQFVDLAERPFRRATDTSGPPFFFLLPDASLPAACTRIELMREGDAARR